MKRVRGGGCSEEWAQCPTGGWGAFLNEWVGRLVSEHIGLGGLVRTLRLAWREGSHRRALDQRGP